VRLVFVESRKLQDTPALSVDCSTRGLHIVHALFDTCPSLASSGYTLYLPISSALMAPTGYTDGDGHLEAGLLKSTEGEKQTGYRDYSPLALKSKSKSNKMIYFRRALLVIVMGFILGLGVATARPGLMNCQRHNDNSKMAIAKAQGSNGELAEALQKASPDLLHRLLHAYLPERYQHGVFATDRDAIDAISEKDPSVASAIVQIAKRQDNGPSNNNSTTAAGPTSTAAGPSSTVAQSSTDVQSSTASSPESTTGSETSSSKLYMMIHLTS
jgi:hypothetical protein